MSVQGWKWWQWLLVSLVVGALIGAMLSTRDVDDPSLPSISMQSFMNKLRLRTDAGEPILTKIRVSPVVADEVGKKVQVVTFWEKQKNKETGTWDPVRQYRMYTPVPVFPKAPSANYGILDFLNDRAKDSPGLDSGYRWWQVPRYAWLISMGGSILAIGVVWPMVIRLLVKLGLGNPEAPQEAGYDLSKVEQRRAMRPAAPAGATEEDAAQLAALNARLEHDVADMMVQREKIDDAEQRRQEAAVIRKLSDQPLEAQDDAARREDDKSFGGEFYPVSRPVTKND